LAWFTLVWPAPAVITGFLTTYAYDSPGNAKELTVQVSHPLFARRLGMRALWEGSGGNPQPSVFVAGNNETHTAMPASIALSGGAGFGLDASAAALQAALQPTYRTLIFGGAGPFGSANGAPSPVSVNDVDGAVAVFQGAVSPDVAQQLKPASA